MTNYDAVQVDIDEIHSQIVANLPFYSYEELEDTMRAAREEGDADMIGRVMGESFDRSTKDKRGVNPDYEMLTRKCAEAIELISPEEK